MFGNVVSNRGVEKRLSNETNRAAKSKGKPRFFGRDFFVLIKRMKVIAQSIDVMYRAGVSTSNSKKFLTNKYSKLVKT